MDRLIRRFCSAVETVAAILIACVTLLIVASAIGRYLVASPVPDAFDIARLLLGACIMWGFAVVGYRGGHISVDLFTLNLPERARRWIEVFAWTVLLFFVVLLVWKMHARVYSAWRSNESTFDLRLPVWPLLGLIWLGAVASLGTISARIYMLATGRASIEGGADDETPTDWSAKS
ncbi:MAG: TRAP transporter small permease [Rhodobacteraceae bacterium]|nr:MAG: TRAP transporter small permease [Paracoccaceae bacterium]